MEHNKTEINDKKSKQLIFVLSGITLLAIGITIWALFFRETDTILTPDYAPQEIEQNQQPIDGDSNEKLEQPEGGGSVSLTYSNEVTIDLSDEKASLFFANPRKSNQDIVVQIVIQEQILVQSGKLTPGNQVTTLNLLDDAAKKLSVGGYEGKFVILYYNPDTGEKAVVNTEIPVSIIVQE